MNPEEHRDSLKLQIAELREQLASVIKSNEKLYVSYDASRDEIREVRKRVMELAEVIHSARTTLENDRYAHRVNNALTELRSVELPEIDT